MDTTTVCLALVSLFDLGWESLTTLGLAKVETIRKNNRRMKRISFSGPVCTSPSSLCLFLRFILIDLVSLLIFLPGRLLQNINKISAGHLHLVCRFINLRIEVTISD